MDYLGVKLQAVEFPLGGRNGRHGARLGPAGCRKALRENAYHIAVAHPDLLAAPEPGEQRIGGFVELQHGQAVLALLALANLAAEQVRHELLSVTDPQYGLSLGKDAGVYRGAPGVVNARRAAGDDDALREGDGRGRGLTGPHFGVDPEIADFPRDQMTVLPARVQDHDLWSGIQSPMVARPKLSANR